MTVTRVLQLVGSPTSAFHVDLSELYARGCVAALSPDGAYRFEFAHVSPDGSWRFPRSLAPQDIAAAPPIALVAAMARLTDLAIDAALPQMFCTRGMTEYRALLELLGIPYLGNRPLQMGVAADKAATKAIVAAAGVAVPQARLVRDSTPLDVPLPVVVKPNSSDNSEGLTLARSSADLPAAIELALGFADAALVEDYIELGREVRCGVIERDGRLICLPLEEYHVDPALRPVRTAANKLARSSGGKLALVAKTTAESWIVPARDPITPRVWHAARQAYRALGLRQYGLFDFRIDGAGMPWFLEAGPYCSFSPQSVIVTMMTAAGTPLDRFFAESLDALLGRTVARTNPTLKQSGERYAASQTMPELLP